MFYVSAIDGGKYWLMLGPFDEWCKAKMMVDKVRDKANELDPRAAFMAFGTCKLDIPLAMPDGRINRYFTEII